MRLLQYNSCINGFFVVNIFELFPTAVYHVWRQSRFLFLHFVQQQRTTLWVYSPIKVVGEVSG